jgi:3-oxoadipate enol-lactonase
MLGLAPEKKEHDEKLISVGKYVINYIEMGQGYPIILVHGLGTSLEFWEKNLESLASCGKVYALDLPGFGNSCKPTEIINTRKMAKILYDWCKAMGIKKAHIIGHSLGGEVCLWFASNYPGMVKSMVLAASTGIKSKVPIKTRLLNLAKNAPFEPFSFLPRLINSYNKAGFVRIMTTILASNPLKLLKKVAKIKVPTLIISGSNDQVVTLDESIDLHLLLPNSRLEIIDGSHGLIFDAHDNFNKAICRFFNTEALTGKVKKK